MSGFLLVPSHLVTAAENLLASLTSDSRESYEPHEDIEDYPECTTAPQL